MRRVFLIVLTIVVGIGLGTLFSNPVVAQTSNNETIAWAFVPSENSQAVLDSADNLAKLVSDKTGLQIKTYVATEYAGVIEAMCNGQAQMGALNTFGYIVASSRKCADVALVSVRNNSTSYKGQIITRVDSGITALTDLKGKTFCRPDPLSTSGWIIPSITLRAEKVNPDTDIKVVDVGNHDAVVENVYNGNCDAGASFVDAREDLVKTHPDVKEKVIVLKESLPIPNDTISFIPSFDAKNRAAIVTALLDIANDPANADVIKKVYNWTGLAEAKDSFFDDFRQQLDAAGVKVNDLPIKAPPKATPAATAAATAAAGS